MHHIQQQILAQLIPRAAARYRDLKPVGMDGNLFTYHLGRLIKDEFILKEDGQYRLSPAGARYAGTLSLATLQPRIQPKIVTLVACQNPAGAWLLYRSRRQPFWNQIGFPYGKIHLGETVLQAASRELLEKTGIAAELWHRGDVYLTIYRDKQLLSQMLTHIFLGRNLHGTLKEESSLGACFWGRLPEQSPEELMPGVTAIAELLQSSNERFFREFVYHV